MPCGVDDRARVRLERLHDHAARRVASAPSRELREQLERALLGAEVGKAEAGVGVDDGRELDAAEVMALRHHLRADEHGALRAREALERLVRVVDVGVEPDDLELGEMLRELALEPLRAGADARELGRAARGTRVPHRLAAPAVVAVQRLVAVQRERDVAVRAASRRAARAAMDGGRETAAVEQEDGLAVVLDHGAERGEERRRQRIPGLAPQVDDAHLRQRPRDAAAEHDPLERLPRLRARRRGTEDGDGALERRALRRDRARVVARVRLLLVRRVVLLVHADDARATAPARTPPSARRRRPAPRPTRCARARRGAPPRRARSGARRRDRRSARGNVRAPAA